MINLIKAKSAKATIIGCFLTIGMLFSSGGQVVQNGGKFQVQPSSLGLTSPNVSKITNFNPPSLYNLVKKPKNIAFVPTTQLSSITDIGLASTAIFNFLQTGFTSIGDTTFPTLENLCLYGKYPIPFANGKIIVNKTWNFTQFFANIFFWKSSLLDRAPYIYSWQQDYPDLYSYNPLTGYVLNIICTLFYLFFEDEKDSKPNLPALFHYSGNNSTPTANQLQNVVTLFELSALDINLLLKSLQDDVVDNIIDPKNEHLISNLIFWAANNYSLISVNLPYLYDAYSFFPQWFLYSYFYLDKLANPEIFDVATDVDTSTNNKNMATMFKQASINISNDWWNDAKKNDYYYYNIYNDHYSRTNNTGKWFQYYTKDPNSGTPISDPKFNFNFFINGTPDEFPQFWTALSASDGISEYESNQYSLFTNQKTKYQNEWEAANKGYSVDHDTITVDFPDFASITSYNQLKNYLDTPLHNFTTEQETKLKSDITNLINGFAAADRGYLWDKANNPTTYSRPTVAYLQNLQNKTDVDNTQTLLQNFTTEQTNIYYQYHFHVGSIVGISILVFFGILSLIGIALIIYRVRIRNKYNLQSIMAK